MKIYKERFLQETEAMKNVAEPKVDETLKHPTPEQLLLREALNILTPKQLELWEFWNYDRLTQEEIAEKLRKDQSTIARNIQHIEKKLAKWIKSNMGAYKLLKGEFESKED